MVKRHEKFSGKKVERFERKRKWRKEKLRLFQIMNVLLISNFVLGFIKEFEGLNGFKAIFLFPS